MRFFCCWSSCLFFVHFAFACHDREYHTGTACIECFKEQFQSVTKKSYSEGCSACAMLSRYIGGFLTLSFIKGYYRLLHLGETTAIQHTRYYIPSLDPADSWRCNWRCCPGLPLSIQTPETDKNNFEKTPLTKQMCLKRNIPLLQKVCFFDVRTGLRKTAFPFVNPPCLVLLTCVSFFASC